LVKNGVTIVAEGANMPTELPAVHLLQENGVIFGPAKAANAGGVAVSGLEQSQNSLRLSWSRQEVDERLKTIMHDIHAKCLQYGSTKNGVDYVAGANIGGFVKVADAMLAQGIL
jgi:glutamate dehydrogenase (NADP+)